MPAQRSRRKRFLPLVIGSGVVATILALLPGQPSPPPKPSPAPTPTVEAVTPEVVPGIRGENLVRLSGQLEVITGDVFTGTLQLQKREVFVGRLTLADGTVREFNLTADQAASLNDGPVKLTVDQDALQSEAFPQVRAVQATLPTVLQAIEDATQGSQPYLNVPCVFAGETPPRPTSHYQNATMSDEPGSLIWTWRHMGVDISGSETLANWCSMPEAKSAYLREDPNTKLQVPDFKKLRDAAILAAKAANPSISFSRFKGLNFIFSSSIGCCFWGGRSYVLPAAASTAGSEQQRFNYTLSDGSCDCWTAIMPHELGHSFPTKPNGAGMGHADDLNGIFGDPWDMMSRPEFMCPDSSTWKCTSQGTSAPQLIQLGVPLVQIKYNNTGILEARVAYLYEPVGDGGTHTIEVPLPDGTSLFIEARRGGQMTPDRKMAGLTCLLARWSNLSGHNLPGRESYKHLLLPWKGDGSEVDNFCGTAGNRLVDHGFIIQVLSPTAAGISIRIGRDGDPGMNIRKVYLPLARG